MCVLWKQFGVLDAILEFYRLGQAALKQGVRATDITALNERERIARLCEVPDAEFAEAADACRAALASGISDLDRANVPIHGDEEAAS